MKSNGLLFRGSVQIYLQGMNALLYSNKDHNDWIRYYIGSPSSRITVKDHRKEAMGAATKILRGIDGIDFADIFNRPSVAEVSETSEGISIELFDDQSNGRDLPILWLGIMEEGYLPARETLWEVYNPIENREIAFASLVE